MVPCSKCEKCIARRISSWSFRLIQEDRISTSSDFITLTYATEHLPFSQQGYPTLQKTDVQLFIKRLRKSQCGNSISPIKYYVCGEYGGHTKRPHYHIILFNAKLELIQPAWSLGNLHYGKVSGASIGYTLKYMCKNKKAFKTSSNDDRQPEFACMSKGLGVSYLNETMCNWHIKDLVNRMFCQVYGTEVKIAMPRYYKEKLYFDMERAAIAEAFKTKIHELQIKKIMSQTAKQFINEQRDIDASFDRMYRSAQKTKL